MIAPQLGKVTHIAIRDDGGVACNDEFLAASLQMLADEVFAEEAELYRGHLVVSLVGGAGILYPFAQQVNQKKKVGKILHFSTQP
jgi:hypothetical protein